ncbi:hypothetical protein J7T55_008354 [Diaporthe amygdali]|uniref:uncharacterized protein n=1 Tax=Phomopsis amygdali TaxID=1214568 RepID=UPI0022FE8E4A|nr:uncharacterized protein J7T55_008354 [Diaporthe amygdali]KAJ0121191.1 hypothetical protein J7T55_008354 [Diaporthe amygdali]
MVAVSTRLHLGDSLYADRLTVGNRPSAWRPKSQERLPKFSKLDALSPYHPIGQAQPCFWVPRAWFPSRLAQDDQKPY